MDDRVRLGISACLLGEQVRFDGGHKRDAFLAGTFAQFVAWVPVCPEVEAGFGTPRESMRLVDEGGDVRVLTVKTRRDVTARLEAASASRATMLATMELDGFVLKKDSPSCGLERVKVYREAGPAERRGRGIFAAALAGALPLLPVEEEGRLQDADLREQFIERVFAHRRLRAFLAGPLRVVTLVDFHTRHKLQLMAHSPQAYARLGRLVAAAGTRPMASVAADYADGFMQALAVPATRGRHVNVLQHMAGYFDHQLESVARRDLAGTIGEYQQGLLPLVVPLTLVTHHVRRFGLEYLAHQVYLQPHPKVLRLRNHG